ncbi:DUF4013 domain-containing protein [Methanobacterium alcaliphilum]|uniref:DUF4013 domain-containing protein n=1 Tax=Methanobacterium alcaliphilum TaxID=392018 RepID=UPI00200A9F64|nr:DUF4013 domain-containing protein [Methanobacterium alcaliphilum]MCK9151065.1 DUF4013 domain-containing protein [Methanobacterium alcaliphilum]
MKIGDMISSSFKFPLKNINRYIGLLLLNLGSILIIPIFLQFGYLLRIIEDTTHGKNELPAFVEWGKMFFDGLKFLSATIIYYILPLSLFVVSLSMMNTLPSIIAVILVIICFIIFFVLNLVYVTALNNMAYTGNFKAIFDFNKILGLIGDMGWINYFAYIFTAGIIVLIFIAVAQVFSLLKVYGIAGALIGTVVSLLLSNYASIFQYRFIGLLFNKMNKLETLEENMGPEIRNENLEEGEFQSP